MKPYFVHELEVRQDRNDGDFWYLTHPFTYRTGTGERITVPRGTRTDFASIPRPLWSLVGSPVGHYTQAAVLHDALYQTGATTRRRADALLYEAMGCLDVRPTQRWAIWAGVRIGGWLAWWRHRNRAGPPDISLAMT